MKVTKQGACLGSLEKCLRLSQLSSRPIFRRAYHSAVTKALLLSEIPRQRHGQVITSTGIQLQTRSRSTVRSDLQRWGEQEANALSVFTWGDAAISQGSAEDINDNIKSDPENTVDWDDDEIEAHNEISSFLDRLISDGEESHLPASQARMGDFVDVSIRRSESRCGVFLGMIGQHAATFLVTGKVQLHPPQRIQFVLPGLATAKETEAVLKHLPKANFRWDTDFKAIRTKFGLNIEDIIPAATAFPLRSKLLDFVRKADEFYRKFAAQFDRVHDQLSVKDAQLLASPSKIASRLHGRAVTPREFQYAAYRVIRSTLGLGFSGSGGVGSDMVEIYPKDDVEMFQKVQKLVRAWTDEKALIERGKPVPKAVADEASHLKRFANLYQKLKAYSAPLMVHYQSKTDGGLSSPVAFKENRARPGGLNIEQAIEFTAEDQMFLRFLMVHTLKEVFSNSIVMRSAFSMILRACEPGAKDFDSSMAKNVLVYMGLMNPAEPLLSLDGRVHNLRPAVNNAVQEMESAATEGAALQQAFRLRLDRMQRIRRDWGDLVAFAIDGEQVSVFDDAVSFETVSGSADECWIRVHIAEPTAFIEPSAQLAKYAQGRNKALYLATGRLSMLPDAITREFSLSSGKPVMTYSARLNRSGEVIETSIEPGSINKIVHCTPNRIDQAAFSIEAETDEHELFAAGSSFEPSPILDPQASALRTDNVSAYSNHFRAALEFLNAFRSRRGEESFPAKISSRSIVVDNNKRFPPQSPITGTPTNRPAYSHDSPAIQVKNVNTTSPDSPASRLVEGAAHLANAIAGEWCARRSIPVPFHGLRRRFAGLQSEDYALMRDEVRRASNSTSGDADRYWRIRAQLMRLMGVRTVMAEPVPHIVLKDPHRTRITNPLRSYIDMVATWQIESALLEEHRRGTSLLDRPRSDDSSFLTFSRATLQDIIEDSTFLDNSSRVFQATHTQALQFNAIARAIATEDPRFPKRLTATISNISRRGEQGQSVRARILELDMSAKAVDKFVGGDGRELEMGDLWEVEIVDVPCVAGKDLLIDFVRRVEAKAVDGGATREANSHSAVTV